VAEKITMQVLKLRLWCSAEQVAEEPEAKVAGSNRGFRRIGG